MAKEEYAMKVRRTFAILLSAALAWSLGTTAFAAQESTAEMEPSVYGTLTYWKTDSMREHRDDTGFIYLGYAV